MDFKQLLETDDERAVSPVIGVILMVAITVILAAVIGAFVIGIGGEQDNAPSASIDFDQSADDVTVSHESGQDLNENEVEIDISGDVDDTIEGSTWSGSGGTVSAGDSVDIVDESDVENSDSGTLQVVWESSDTDTSSVLADFDFDLS